MHAPNVKSIRHIKSDHWLERFQTEIAQSRKWQETRSVSVSTALHSVFEKEMNAAGLEVQAIWRGTLDQTGSYGEAVHTKGCNSRTSSTAHELARTSSFIRAVEGVDCRAAEQMQTKFVRLQTEHTTLAIS